MALSSSARLNWRAPAPTLPCLMQDEGGDQAQRAEEINERKRQAVEAHMVGGWVDLGCLHARG